MARILLVDDHATLRSVLERYLRSRGHAVTAVPSAESALYEVGRRRTDVVVTDLRMPGMDGRELLRILHGRDRSTPVIVMSGGDPRHDETPGAAAVLRKPFGPSELCDAVDRVLARELSEGGAVGA